MNKIIALFDGTKYSEATSKYAIEIAKADGSLLVGAFIYDLRYLNYTYAFGGDQPYFNVQEVDTWYKEQEEKIALNIKLFHRLCSEKGIHHKVHLDKGIPFKEALNESAFADLLIVDSHTGFSVFNEKRPAVFLKDLLADAHCPVLIVPHHYSYFDKVIICYDGQPSSLYAMKMFSYLFPNFRDVKTVLLGVSKSVSNHFENGHNLKDLVKNHFDDAEYEMLHGETEAELISYLKENGGNSIVVMGSYARSAVSRLFQQSHSNEIIRELNLPVFITHQ